MQVIRRRAVVRGRVQGVGFRAGTRSQARRLGLTGFARNRPDGTVEVEAEGAPAGVAELVAWLHSGPRWATVEGVEVTEVPAAGSTGFDLR